MNVLTYTLCYPPGECHPDALLEQPPEGVELSGNYEGYEFQADDRVPSVGDVQGFPDSGLWTIVAVESYAPATVSDLAGFYHFICTRDGKLSQRDEKNGYTVLGLMMDGQTIVEREPGWADWWYGSAASIPKPSPNREVLTFLPKDSNASFDTVVVCRSLRVLQAI